MQKIKAPTSMISEGTCFSQCIQYILKCFLGDNFEPYIFLGLEDNLYVKYNKLDDAGREVGGISRNFLVDNIKIINSKINLNIEMKSFSGFNEAIKKIKDDIEKNKPTFIAVNPYYISYMKDYLKKPGGYFEFYHMCCIVGINEEKREFIMADLTKEFTDVRISFENLNLAWTFSEGIDKFIPYLYYEYDKKNILEIKNLMEVSKLSALKNLNYIIYDECNLKQIIVDLKTICEGKVNDCTRKIYLGNLFRGIFDILSWSRRLFSDFLKAFKCNRLKENSSYIEEFYHFYKQWSKIGNIIYLGITNHSEKRLNSAIEKITKLLNEEVEVSKQLRKVIMNAKFD